VPSLKFKTMVMRCNRLVWSRRNVCLIYLEGRNCLELLARRGYNVSVFEHVAEAETHIAGTHDMRVQLDRRQSCAQFGARVKVTVILLDVFLLGCRLAMLSS